MVKRVLKDPVIYLLMTINIGLAYAYFNQLISAETILYTYYFQSVMLGLSYFFQIMTIHNFTVAELKINGKQVEKTKKTRGCVGMFFLFHYGFFHLVYLIFLSIVFHFNVDYKFLLSSVIAFGLGEFIAVIRRNMMFNNEQRNIGTMMFTPYLRIIPLHLFIISGGFFGYGNNLVFTLFIFLKIISDALMHIIVNKTYKEAEKNGQPPIINI